MSGNIRLAFTILVALTQLAIVGWLDYITSYEISLAILYFFPIAYASWNLGKTWSFCLSGLSASVLTWAEIAAGREYSNVWILAERGVMRLLVFGFVAFSFNYFRNAIDRERAKVRRLESILGYCSCCYKVSDGEGNWFDMATFLRENKDGRPGVKMCPTCAREVYATGGCIQRKE